MGPSARSSADTTVKIGSVTVVTRRVTDLDKAARRALADSIRDRLGTGVVVVASVTQEKVALLVSVTPDLVETVHAGQLVKTLAPIVGGRGGGKPDFAEAGGQQPDKIQELVDEAQRQVARILAQASAGRN